MATMSGEIIMEKPGNTIRHNKTMLSEAVLSIVEAFEDATDVTVQSVHYYRDGPDPKLLNDKGKQRVDIILKL